MNISPVNRRVVGSSPTWGASETAENQRSAVFFLSVRVKKQKKRTPFEVQTRFRSYQLKLFLSAFRSSNFLKVSS